VRLFAWLWPVSWFTDAALAFWPGPHTPIFKPPKDMSMAVFLVLMVLILAFVMQAYVQTVWGRQNSMRWVLFVLFLVSLPRLTLIPLLLRFHAPVYSLAEPFAQTLIQAVAFYFIFTGDARPWFRHAVVSGVQGEET
jgi:hypothetical protein